MREDTSILGGPQPFPPTSWTLVRGSREHHERLDGLCRRYWGPVYFYIRRNWGKTVEESKDLTQGFFLSLFEHEFLKSIDEGRGKFRSFLCAALHHFLCNRARHDAALKRTPVPPPEREFVEDWKRAVVEAALERLRAQGKTLQVELLTRYALAPDPPKYDDLARELGITVSQVTNGLHAARKAFKAACLDEIRDTVSDDEDFREEARTFLGT